MKLEIPTSVDQLEHPALRLLALRPELFALQGSVVAGWRHRGEKTFGPYYRLAYRENGRQHSIYLGREGELVEQVRRTLGSIQRPRAEHRAIRRLERQVLSAFRVEKIRLGSLLRPYGLRLKGMEVRGWRCSPLRRFLPRRRQLKPRISVLGWKPVSRRPNPDPPAVRLARYLEARGRSRLPGGTCVS